MTLLFLCQINVVPEIQGTVNVEAASRKTKKCEECLQKDAVKKCKME